MRISDWSSDVCSSDLKFTPPTEGVSLSMTREAAKHEGVVVITGAKIVTMADKDGGVIENGAIVIDGDRITAVGPAGAITVPPGAVTIDAAEIGRAHV